MSDLCTDNRFIIIEKAKEDILESTNIDTSPDEMKVLDNFLFRCWQMGWLKEYDDASHESSPFSQDYLEGYSDGYKLAYKDGYEKGMEYVINRISNVLDKKGED